MSAAPQSIRLRSENRHARSENDWYQEPIWATEALLKAEPFDGLIYDPCCGGGNIVTACRAAGHVGHGSDLVDRANGRFSVFDFLARPPGFANFDNILMNPPFSLAEKFIEQALTCATRKVGVLQRLAFLEGKARGKLFSDAWPFARLWVHSRRLSMPPGGQNIRAVGGAVAYAWFIFEHGHHGKPSIGWLP